MHTTERKRNNHSGVTAPQMAHFTCTHRIRLEAPSKDRASVLASQHESERVVDASESNRERHLGAHSKIGSNHAKAGVRLFAPLSVWGSSMYQEINSARLSRRVINVQKRN